MTIKLNITEQNLGIFSDITHKMESTLLSFNESLTSLSTGRANTNLLHPIKFEAYGTKTPINTACSITTPDSKTLLVQVWDKELVSDVEKAIINSNLGLVPNTKGQVIRLNVPTISKERRKNLVKKASEYSEQGKIAIRNIRRSSIELLKKQEKNKSISQDDLKNHLRDIQKITDKFISKIDSILSDKSRDIMTI